MYLAKTTFNSIIIAELSPHHRRYITYNGHCEEGGDFRPVGAITCAGSSPYPVLIAFSMCVGILEQVE